MVPSPARRLMHAAFEQAVLAAARGEVPVGAVAADLRTGEILAADGNRTRERCDPGAHAEMLVIRAACALRGEARLRASDVIAVTLEPCPMCAQAISFARPGALWFGAYDPKGGGTEHGARVFERSSCFHVPEIIGGVMETECAELLRLFFNEKRRYHGTDDGFSNLPAGR